MAKTKNSKTKHQFLEDFFTAAALAGIMANPVRWLDIQRRYDQKKLTYEEASEHNARKALSIARAVMKLRSKSTKK